MVCLSLVQMNDNNNLNSQNYFLTSCEHDSFCIKTMKEFFSGSLNMKNTTKIFYSFM